jgi:hypothetical protein
LEEARDLNGYAAIFFWKAIPTSVCTERVLALLGSPGGHRPLGGSRAEPWSGGVGGEAPGGATMKRQGLPIIKKYGPAP